MWDDLDEIGEMVLSGEGSNPSSSSWGKYTRTLVTQVGLWGGG
jgi:hypothetical protein